MNENKPQVPPEQEALNELHAEVSAAGPLTKEDHDFFTGEQAKIDNARSEVLQHVGAEAVGKLEEVDGMLLPADEAAQLRKAGEQDLSQHVTAGRHS